MKKYLLDTNICVFFLRGRFDVSNHIGEVGWNNCCISEITIAELLYGAENSNDIKRNIELVESFCENIEVIPISHAIHTYAKEKVRLRKKGTPIEDLDLLIGATAKAHGLVLVTENFRHLERIEGLELENWIQR